MTPLSKHLQRLMLAIVAMLFGMAGVLQCAAQPGPIGGGLWIPQGGAPIWDGEAGVANGEVGGAIQSVVQHPTDADIMWVGTVNGGIWRTFDATAASPSWTPLTDFAPSLSISSLVLDPTDHSCRTLVAGLSSESSFGRQGSSVNGLLRTTNGGDNWTYLDGGGVLADKDISDVISCGSIIIASATESRTGILSTWGIYRSTNYGATFTLVSSQDSQNGIPFGRAHVLISDPTNLAVLYTVLLARNGGTNGIYKSSNMGITWSKVSTTLIDNILPNCNDGVRMSATIGNTVYIGIADSNSGGIVHVFRSPDGGDSWNDLGLARSDEAGRSTISVSFVAMALLADPGNSNILYVGGSDNLRCDVSQPLGRRWARMSGCISSPPPNNGNITCSSPHTDSRNMTIDLDGNLILVCDGGIYRRTSPRTYDGFWSSIIGDLQVGEYHDVAYDANFGVSVCGTQDCGAQRQVESGQTLWAQIVGGDGGPCAVDSTSTPGRSIVYASDSAFHLFRLTFDSSFGLVTNFEVPLVVIGGGAALQSQFDAGMKLNLVNPQHIVIGGANSVYESLDQGNTIAEIGPGIAVGRGDGFAYGGWSLGVANPDVLYAAAATGVMVRTNAGGSLTNTPTPFPGATPEGVAMLPTDWRTIYVIDINNVYLSSDAGNSWTNITGNLTGCGNLTCVRAGPTNEPPSVLVGTYNGIYVSSGPNLGFWSKVGTNLPSAPVFSFEYNQDADVLLAGTLGRGAWLITNASSTVFAPSPPEIGNQPLSQSVLIDSSAVFTAAVGGTPPFSYQWRKNGMVITGATNATLLVSLCQTTDMGNYDLVVGNAIGTNTSHAASLVVTSSPTENCAMSAPAGLISWWTGEGTANDRVGTNNGMLENGASYALGKVGYAFSFNGDSQYVSIPDNSAWGFGTNAFSIDLWANFSALGGAPAFLANDEGGGSTYKWIFWLNGPTLQLHVNMPNGDATYVGAYNFTPIVGQWYHIALTRNGNTFEFYVNGNLVSSDASSVVIPTAHAPLTIGDAEGNFYFNGLLDEVQIYDRALSPSEIQAIYQAGTNGMCPPTPLALASQLIYNKTDGVILSANLRSGQSYHLQATTNLGSTNWANLTNFIAATAPVISITNKPPTNTPELFYRIVTP